jgi:hypothetical protein
VTRALIVGATAVLALTLTACTSVLGLDPPTLALEAGADSADSGAAESSCAPIDAAPDVIPPGVQCGGGCFGLVTYCTAPKPVCCQTTNDAGATTYTCTTSESMCNGYPIACANDDDCPGQDICCHSTMQMWCATTAACPNTDLVCRPWKQSNDCQTGQACDKPAMNAGVTSPYLLCEP